TDMNKETIESVYTEGPVRRVLFVQTFPMIIGALSAVIFNLTDTFFIGKLGSNELSAISFTFPVILVVGCIAQGLGMGASAMISRAVGEKNKEKVQQLTTDSLLLTFFVSVLFSIAGLLTIRPLFSFLGASNEILNLISEYMSIYYFGMIAVLVPRVGNNAIRAKGDVKVPGLIMMISAITNLVLDPFLIFGIGPFPRMELAGAATSTVIARAVTLIASISFLYFRDKLILLKTPDFKSVIKSWKEQLYIGLPVSGVHMLTPVLMGIITRMLSSYGPEIVAAFGVASRIESLVLIFFLAFSSVLGPFIGQNLGAEKMKRIAVSIKFGNQISLVWGFVTFLVMYFLGNLFAVIFSNDPVIVENTVKYLRIVSSSYAFAGIITVSVTAFNVLRKPFNSVLIMLFQVFAVFLPLALIAGYFFRINGIWISVALSNLIIGIMSLIWLGNVIKGELLKSTPGY
ncbi:MAG: MATE family efflux transporter, partial [Fibrobacter sp.]|nr:MATE family efflux transporter [Fibrobacter sp.]